MIYEVIRYCKFPIFYHITIYTPMRLSRFFFKTKSSAHNNTSFEWIWQMGAQRMKENWFNTFWKSYYSWVYKKCQSRSFPLLLDQSIPILKLIYYVGPESCIMASKKNWDHWKVIYLSALKRKKLKFLLIPKCSWMASLPSYCCIKQSRFILI